MPRCTGCGAWVDDETFCDRCGAKLPDDAPDDRWHQHSSQGPQSESEPARTGADDEQRPPQRREPTVQFLLRQPLRAGHRPLVVSAVLLLASPLVIPVLALFGYSHRLGRSVAVGAMTPPSYGDWGRLVVDGVGLLAVLVVPSLLWTAGAVAVTWLLLFALPFAGGLVVLTALFGLLGLVWLTSACVAALAGTNSVAATFTRGRVRSLLAGDGYLTLWLVLVVFVFLLALVVAVLSGSLYALLAADIGLALAAPLGVLALAGLAVVLGYATLVGATCTGYIYYRMADRGVVPDATDARSTHAPNAQ